MDGGQIGQAESRAQMERDGVAPNGVLAEVEPGSIRLLGTDRLEAFSDGVFAVAITLLVFGIATPHVGQNHLAHALLTQWLSYATYIVSFLTIGIIWVNHHGTFSRIVGVDRPLLFINLMLLLTVSFIPYPTSVMSEYIRQGGNNARAAAVLYAATMTAMSFAFSGIWLYAIKRGRLRADRIDVQRARATVPRFGIGMLIYGASIGLALVSPKLDLLLFGALAVFYVFDQQAV